MNETPSPLATDLAAYAAERDALLKRIVHALEADARVAAAFLSGSFGRGDDDAWSDFDLHVAVQDDAFEAFLAERPRLYARAGRPVLVQREMPSDAMPAARFQLVIFSGPIEVDWNIGPLGEAVRPAHARILFDRAGIPLMPSPSLDAERRRTRLEDSLIFFWAMAPIALKYAARGETRRAAGQINLLTGAVIGLWRLLHNPLGPEPFVPAANRPVEPDLDAALPRLGATIDPSAALTVIRSLCALVEGMHAQMAAQGVPTPHAMPGEVTALAAIAETTIARGEFPRRPYR